MVLLNMVNTKSGLIANLRTFQKKCLKAIAMSSLCPDYSMLLYDQSLFCSIPKLALKEDLSFILHVLY